MLTKRYIVNWVSLRDMGQFCSNFLSFLFVLRCDLKLLIQIQYKPNIFWIKDTIGIQIKHTPPNRDDELISD